MVQGVFQPQHAPPGVADVRGLFEAERVDQLRDVRGKVAQHVAGDGLVRLPVAAIVRGDDVVAVLEGLGDGRPG